MSPTPEHTNVGVLKAIWKHESAGTREVADEFGIARQSADYRLRELLDEGCVVKQKNGNSLAWFVAER